MTEETNDHDEPIDRNAEESFMRPDPEIGEPTPPRVRDQVDADERARVMSMEKVAQHLTLATLRYMRDDLPEAGRAEHSTTWRVYDAEINRRLAPGPAVTGKRDLAAEAIKPPREPQVALYTNVIAGQPRPATRIHIGARLPASGGLVVEGQDLGDAPEGFFGSDEYEYANSIAPADLPALRAALIVHLGTDGQATDPSGESAERSTADVFDASENLAADPTVETDHTPASDETLLELVKAVFGGDPNAVTAFGDFCDRAGIERKFWSWR